MERFKIQLKEINRMIKEVEAERAECNKNIKIAYEYCDLELAQRCEETKAEANKILRRLRSVKKKIMCAMAEFTESETSTEDTESPVAEVSRLLTAEFEVCNSFGTVNSEEIANLIGRKLSTNQMHKAILKNFNGVRFRKQNGGFTYTLRRRDTVI